MADISVLARLLNGAMRNVDLTNNTPVVLSIKIGGGSNTELTKAILDRLVSLQNGSDVDATYHTHDGRYFTETELGSASGTTGSDLIGDDASYSNFTPAAATVKGALSGIDAALATAGSTTFSDADFAVYNDSDNTKIANMDVSGVATGTTRTITMPDEDVDLGLVSTAIQSTEKGANNGVATLDGGGKIPASQLPNSVMEYQGNWDADTNTPTLADGVGNAGDVYRVNVAGTQDLGSGSVDYSVGDWVVYNGTIWEKSINSDAVVSVNGQSGIVILDTDDIAEGANLYFTDERGQDAVGSILTDTATIDFTYDDSTPAITADVKNNSIGNAKLTTGVFDQDTITGGNGAAGIVQSAPLMKRVLVAGESFAANTSFLVRFALTGETAGRVYKADKDASSSAKYAAIGIALSGAGATAGQNITVIMMGEHTLGSSDTPFAGGDVGKELFVGTTGAFILGAALANTTNEAQFCVGVVETTTKIWIDNKQLRGIA